MNVQSAAPDAALADISLPFALLAIDPSLQGICLWGQRAGTVEASIEWLLRKRSAQDHHRQPQHELRPVRLPANATPASVNSDRLAQARAGLLERARGGVLIIESADLVSRPTAAALARSLARLPLTERPLLIARSEEHPSRWPLIAEQCAFWVQEPRPNTAWIAGSDGFTDEDPAAVGNVRVDEGAGGIEAAATRLQALPLTPDVVRQAVVRSQSGGTVPANAHGVDRFVVRAAAALAALHNAPKIESGHIEAAWQLVGAPRFAEEEPTEQTSSLPDTGDATDTGEPTDHDTSDKSAAPLTGPPSTIGRTEHPPRTPGADEDQGHQPESQSDSEASAQAADMQGFGDPTDAGSPAAHRPDDSGGGDASRVVVVPAAELFDALALPAAERLRPVARARRGATGTPAGVTSRYISGQPLALGATLQAAIPWQRLRRPRSETCAPTIIRITPEDLRIQRRRPRPKVLYIIAVDGSGSMAQGRMQLAKSAALAVLAGAYKERRSVSLIDFRGHEATLMSPPGRSSAAIRRLITTLPSGGGTPLPAALALARDVARRWLRNDPTGSVTLILFTDGKANVPLEPETPTPLSRLARLERGSADRGAAAAHLDASVTRRAVARHDTIKVGGQLRAAGVNVQLVDSNSWRPAPELYDLAEILAAPIVRIAHPSLRHTRWRAE